MSWFEWISIGIGIIGIITGIIGLLCLRAANSIKNKATAKDHSSIQQANTIIHNGLDGAEVVKLSKETTQEIVDAVIKQLNVKIDSKQPRIKYGEELPKDGKEGNIFFLLNKEI